jgi:GNAT superfamily N-acetyltransferase
MKDGFTVQSEKFAEIRDELPELFARQYGELVTDKDGLYENPDYQRYFELERLGVLYCLTARKGPILIGYFFNMVSYHLHHKGLKTSMSDLVYVLPEYRNGTGVGLELMQAGMSQMKQLGVNKMYLVTKNDTRMAQLAGHLGFRPIEEVHSLWIGD